MASVVSGRLHPTICILAIASHSNSVDFARQLSALPGELSALPRELSALPRELSALPDNLHFAFCIGVAFALSDLHKQPVPAMTRRLEH